MGYLKNLGLAVIGRQLAPVSESRSIEDPSVSISDALSNLDSIGSISGESVSPRKALSIPALYQAVSMISGDVAKLPMGVWRRRADGGRELFREHHAFKRVNLVGMANQEVNAFKFWRRLMVSALLWNNGYAWIDKNGRGEVLGLYNLCPDRTAPARIKGQLWYLTEVGRKLTALPADEVFHIEGLSLDGFHGEHLVKLFRDLFGASLAKRKFTSKFFKNGMMAGGVLAVPPGAKPETVRKVQAGLKEKYSNTDNAFKTIVLRDGYKWFSTQVDPQKAQLTASTEQDAREIARVFNLKAGRLSVEGATSYNADEMAIRDYHDGTLSHWLIGSRCEANAKLRTPEEIEADNVYLDYNINALQWADAKTRSEIANSGIANGRWSPNETRGWENLNPYEGGDTFYRPLNLEPVGAETDSDEEGEDESQNDTSGNRESDGARQKAGGWRRVKTGSPLRSRDSRLSQRESGNDAREEAARRLAEQTIERARNRVRIKLERCKSDEAKATAIDDQEMATLRDMLEPACCVLGSEIEGTLAGIVGR